MLRAVFSALVLTLFIPAIARSEDPREAALASLRGTWVCIEHAGKKPRHEYKLIVDKLGNYKMGGTSGEMSDFAMLAGVEGKVKFDKTKSPPMIDLEGPKNMLRGLYKVEGERLLIVVGPVGTRPTSFDGGDGIVHVFQREEEKK